MVVSIFDFIMIISIPENSGRRVIGLITAQHPSGLQAGKIEGPPIAAMGRIAPVENADGSGYLVALPNFYCAAPLVFP